MVVSVCVCVPSVTMLTPTPHFDQSYGVIGWYAKLLIAGGGRIGLKGHQLFEYSAAEISLG